MLLLANTALTQLSFAGFENSYGNDDDKKLALAKAEMRKQVGQSFYAYFPRQSCMWLTGDAQIQSKPSMYDTTRYKSDTPKSFLVEGIVTEAGYSEEATDAYEFSYYYRLKLEDGSIGYVAVKYFKVGNPNDETSVENECFLQLNPDELVSRLDKLKSDRIAAIAEATKLKLAEDEKQKLAMAESQKLADAAIQADLAERHKKAPLILREMSKDDFCAAYGNAVRGEEINDLGTFPDIMTIVKPEVRRRKLMFNDSQIREEKVRVGMTQCQLFAVWGLPREQNRTVGKWGVHIQHVYGNSYIYTENGQVTSWQD